MGPKLSVALFLLVQPLVLIFAAHHDVDFLAEEWVVDFLKPTASSKRKVTGGISPFHKYEFMANDTVSTNVRNHLIPEAVSIGIHPTGIRPRVTEQTHDISNIMTVNFPITHVIDYYDMSLLLESGFHILLAAFAFQRSRLFALSQLFFGLFALMHHISHHHLTVEYMFWPTHYCFLFAVLLQPLSSGKTMRLRDALTLVCIDTLSVFRPPGILPYVPRAPVTLFLLLWIQWDNRAFRRCFLWAAPLLLWKFYQCEFMHNAPHNEFDTLFAPFFCISCIFLYPNTPFPLLNSMAFLFQL